MDNYYFPSLVLVPLLPAAWWTIGTGVNCWHWVGAAAKKTGISRIRRCADCSFWCVCCSYAIVFASLMIRWHISCLNICRAVPTCGRTWKDAGHVSACPSGCGLRRAAWICGHCFFPAGNRQNRSRCGASGRQAVPQQRRERQQRRFPGRARVNQLSPQARFYRQSSPARWASLGKWAGLSGNSPHSTANWDGSYGSQASAARCLIRDMARPFALRVAPEHRDPFDMHAWTFPLLRVPGPLLGALQFLQAEHIDFVRLRAHSSRLATDHLARILAPRTRGRMQRCRHHYLGVGADHFTNGAFIFCN